MQGVELFQNGRVLPLCYFWRGITDSSTPLFYNGKYTDSRHWCRINVIIDVIERVHVILPITERVCVIYHIIDEFHLLCDRQLLCNSTFC